MTERRSMQESEAQSRWRPRVALWVRALLLTLPSLAVLAVAIHVLRSGPLLRGARVFVGPYPTSQLAFRAMTVVRVDERERPLTQAVHVQVRSEGGWQRSIDLSPDALGVLEVNLAIEGPLGGYLDLELRAAGSAPEDHAALLAATRWARQASSEVGRGQRGGWLEGVQTGGLRVRAGLASGVAAVPFPARVWAQVDRDGAPAAGAKLGVQLSGGRARVPEVFTTDAAGFASFELVPEEHRVELTLSARMGDMEGQLRCSVPVVPGAIALDSRDGVLSFWSATPRSNAYVNWVDESQILRVQTAGFREEGDYFVARLPQPQDLRPRWAVVSSEPDAQSMALVGWPLGDARSPQVTNDLRMRLLTDGLVQASLRAGTEQARSRRGLAQWLFVAMIVEAWLLFVHVRYLSPVPQLPSAVTRKSSAASGLGFGVALLLLALAFGALMLFVTLVR